jgi:hypothetical protein
MLLSLASLAFASVCPPPDEGSPVSLAPDGDAYALAADATQVCWWILDDRGDARLGARWDRARRYPVALVALADDRVALVLRSPEGWSLGVRGEGIAERRLALDTDRPPDRLLAHPDLALVALAWTRGDAARITLVDVDALKVVATASVPAAHAQRLAFRGAGPTFSVDDGWLLVTPGRRDGPR